ncbi:MAG: hypothetical protein JWR52_1790 [Marmoricola sp.]|nr:hypothetical protein [Marmoricola sp.]
MFRAKASRTRGWVQIVALAVSGAMVQSCSSGSALPAHAWRPTSAQLAGLQMTAAQFASIQKQLIQVATADDPQIADTAAINLASNAATWPPNVTKAEIRLTDRQTALKAMGSPGAAPGDRRRVYLIKLSGSFIPRGVPAPRGAIFHASPYLEETIDPVSGDSLDFGTSDSSMDMSSPTTVRLSLQP